MLLHTNTSSRRKTDSSLVTSLQYSKTAVERRGEWREDLSPLPMPVLYSDIFGLASLLTSFQKGIPLWQLRSCLFYTSSGV